LWVIQKKKKGKQNESINFFVCAVRKEGLGFLWWSANVLFFVE